MCSAERVGACLSSSCCGIIRGSQHQQEASGTAHALLWLCPLLLASASVPAFTCLTISLIALLLLLLQMTNWDYYEAVKRFQRVLEVSGINAALQEAGCTAGDTVAIGDQGEFVYSDDQSEAATYGAWLEDMDNRGKSRQGVARWPTPRG